MRSDDIKQGIEYLYELESEKVFLEDTIEGVKREMRTLGHEITIQYDEPRKEENKYESSNILVWGGMVAGCIYGFIWGVRNGHGSSGLDVIITVPIGLLFCGVVGMSIGCVLDYVVSTINRIKRQKVIDEEHEIKTRNAKRTYEAAVREDKIRMKVELSRKTALRENVNELKNSLEENEKELNSLYDTLSILPEYRGFIQIGYMYQMVRIGIEPRLTGDKGLYDRVRRELRADNIEKKLDQIRSAIIDSNNRLYGAISEINSRANRMITAINRETEQLARNQQGLEAAIGSVNSNMSRISSSASLAAYNTERSRKLLEYKEFRNRNGLK